MIRTRCRDTECERLHGFSLTERANESRDLMVYFKLRASESRDLMLYLKLQRMHSLGSDYHIVLLLRFFVVTDIETLVSVSPPRVESSYALLGEIVSGFTALETTSRGMGQ